MEYVESDVKEFVRRLPELTVSPPTVHLAMLVVRSKKVKELLGYKLSDLVVERDIVRAIKSDGGLLDELELALGERRASWRDRYFSKIHNLAVLQHHGRYDVKTEKKNISRIPTEAMGILATISPRNVYSATATIMKDNITHLYSRDESADISLAMLTSRFFGALHKHKTRDTHFVAIDIDTLDSSIYKDVYDSVSSYPKFMITETSGGYHVVLNLTKSEDAADWHGQNGGQQQLGLRYPPIPDPVTANLRNIIEYQADSQEPIPGTLYCRKGGEHHFVRLIE